MFGCSKGVHDERVELEKYDFDTLVFLVIQIISEIPLQEFCCVYAFCNTLLLYQLIVP